MESFYYFFQTYKNESNDQELLRLRNALQEKSALCETRAGLEAQLQQTTMYFYVAHNL